MQKALYVTSKATSTMETLCERARYKLCDRDSVAYIILFTTSLTSAAPRVLDGFWLPRLLSLSHSPSSLSLGILMAVENSRPASYFARGPHQKLASFDQLVNSGLVS